MVARRAPELRAAEYEDAHPRLLERRRILLGNEEVRKQLHMLRVAFREFQQAHPDVVGLGVYGSRVSGYADTSSDFDLALSVDFSRFTSVSRGEDASLRDVKKLRTQAIEFFSKRLGVAEDQFDVQVEYVDIKMPEITALSPNLFFLSFGDLRPYRKAVIERIEQMGPIRETLWHTLMDSCASREGRDRLSDEVHTKRASSLYPQRLAEARSYFLRGTGSDL